MAGKKDLVEAQAFSRRRLLTAFVSGAPGGRELEPTKPLRAVVAGVSLSVLLVLGSLGFGLLRPALPQGWDDNALVTTDGGSRYVAVDGVLYPVLNTTSARLVVPSAEFRVHSVADERIADAPRGSTIGIPGAPDALPSPDRLVATSWLACTADGAGEALVLSTDGTVAEVTDRALAAVDTDPQRSLLVEVAGDLHLVTDGRRHLVPREDRDGVLRALGQETTVPWSVSALWLGLFPAGTPLEPLAVERAGEPLPPDVAAPPGATIGSVLVATDIDQRYVLLADGSLAVLGAVAEPLHRLASGAAVGEPIEVTSAQIAALRSAPAAFGPADWPVTRPEPGLPDASVGCALLVTDPGADDGARVHLVGADEVAVPEAGTVVRVQPSAGALVRTSSGGASGPVQVVDQTGTAFSVPEADPEVLARLGFAPEDVTTVPAAWLRLVPSGPALTVGAAQAVLGPVAGDAG
jgi:type VII secretion protein EccB